MGSFNKILEAMNKAKTGGGYKNDNEGYWSCETDKAGNGYAVIRFLEGVSEDDAVFVKLFKHSFQGPGGKWLIENCPTTIGEDCPVCSANGPLFKSGKESDKDIGRKRKRKVSFVSNILVLSDPAHPENEGKIFLFRYNKTIFDKCIGAMQPEFADEVAFNPFSIKEGANFKIKIRKVDDYFNFDRCEFESISDVSSKVDMSQWRSLDSFVDPKEFKSYDELQNKLDSVLNGRPAKSETNEAEFNAPNEPDREVRQEQRQAPKAQMTVAEDDDDMAFFKNLVDD